jgi:hypothetical protein
MKRTLVLFGAGASIEYGAPSTTDLTEIIGREVAADRYMKHTGGDAAYLKVRDTLAGYLMGVVNFEQNLPLRSRADPWEPTPGAVDEYRPLMKPFLANSSGLDRSTLTGWPTRSSR